VSLYHLCLCRPAQGSDPTRRYQALAVICKARLDPRHHLVVPQPARRLGTTTVEATSACWQVYKTPCNKPVLSIRQSDLVKVLAFVAVAVERTTTLYPRLRPRDHLQMLHTHHPKTPSPAEEIYLPTGRHHTQYSSILKSKLIMAEERGEVGLESL